MELELRAVTFSYKRTIPPALRDFSAVFSGGVYGLLGANGAGKSTLISLIVGLFTTGQGEILYGGKPIAGLGAAYYDRLGYLPQAPRFYGNYTIRVFLLYMAALKGIKGKAAAARCKAAGLRRRSSGRRIYTFCNIFVTQYGMFVWFLVIFFAAY